MDRELGRRIRARAAGRRKVRVVTTVAAVGGVALTAGLGVAFAATEHRPSSTVGSTHATRTPRHQEERDGRRHDLQPPIVPPVAASTDAPAPDVRSGGS